MIVDEDYRVGYGINGLKTYRSIINGSLLCVLFMLKGEDNKGIYRFIRIAFFYLLCQYGYCAGAGTAGGTGDKQEGI